MPFDHCVRTLSVDIKPAEWVLHIPSSFVLMYPIRVCEHTAVLPLVQLPHLLAGQRAESGGVHLVDSAHLTAGGLEEVVPHVRTARGRVVQVGRLRAGAMGKQQMAEVLAFRQGEALQI